MKRSAAPISAISTRWSAMSEKAMSEKVMSEKVMSEKVTADAAPLLEVAGIETCYGLSQVLFGLSLSIRTGEMVTLMGRNGMGKTTTVRSIMGLTPARAGTIRFGDREVRRLAPFRIAQMGIGLVPE